MAPCIESLIVIDRLLYLKEQVRNNYNKMTQPYYYFTIAISGVSLGGVSFQPNQVAKMFSISCFKIISQIKLTKN